MDNRRRNQLIGFITLVLVALVFSPYILTDKSMQHNYSIPLLSVDGEENTIVSEPTLVIDDLDQIVQALPESSVQITTEDRTILPLSTTSPRTENVVQSTNNNYSIQLVALKNKQKIEELVALLRLNNYDVYLEPPNYQDQQITRLLVGQYPTKEQAETVVIDLQHLTKLKGIVVNK